MPGGLKKKKTLIKSSSQFIGEQEFITSETCKSYFSDYL